MLRFLVATHLYIGTALCLVFVAWFASGIVMMYAGYPVLSETEKLARTQSLDWSEAQLLPAEAYRAAGISDSPAYVRAGMLLGRPVYMFLTGEGWLAVSADDGSLLSGIGPDAASRIVRQFEPTAAAPAHEGLFTSPDQWTIYSVWARFAPSYGFSPFHRFSIGDAAGTRIYVLDGTGDVTQRTTRSGRFWGYVGAVVHWIYPTALRARYVDAWRDLIVWLSAIGTVLCVIGLVLGVYEYRWRRSRGVSRSPFRGWLAWHHYVGLLFGLIACTWVFSGLMSMDPWQWSRTVENPLGTPLDAMRGGPLGLDSFDLPPAAAAAACVAELDVKEIRLVQLGGEPYYQCVETPFRSALVAANGAGPDLFGRFPEERLAAAARRLVPGATIAASEWLHDYDAYYYPGWQDKLIDGAMKRLPVLRVKFDDRARTVAYLDPHSGAPLRMYDTSARWLRWLFNGLHSLDFPGLYSRRPLWDLIVLPLMLGGTVLSITGTWLGFRWLKRKLQGARRWSRPLRATPCATSHHGSSGA